MFKSQFKKYKSKSSPADLEDVLNPNDTSKKVEIRCPHPQEPQVDVEKLGLIPPEEWKIFYVNSQPGLLIVKNPFTWKGQRFWIQKCLKEYPVHPNKTNLDLHGELFPGENWWNVCQTDPCRKQFLYKKLRWVTLGYHHNWNSKKYSECSKSNVPEELVELCRVCAKVTGNWDTTAQAAIINFYPLGSTLSGHVDFSEPNDKAPIFSFSFGGRAIFLIGNEAVNQENTTAILLESGDVVVMSEESRLAIHGVPKVMEPIHPYPWNSLRIESFSDRQDWNSYEDYVTYARININLRQVLRPGQIALEY